MAPPVTAFIVVAIAGLVLPLRVRKRKLLEHCGVTIVEIPPTAEALNELRRKVRVDAVVVDARSLPASAEVSPEFVALTACGRSAAPDGPMAVVVLGNRRVPDWMRSTCDRIGARFLRTRPRGPNYPELIRVLRDMCGLSNDCCVPTSRHRHDEAWR